MRTVGVSQFRRELARIIADGESVQVARRGTVVGAFHPLAGARTADVSRRSRWLADDMNMPAQPFDRDALLAAHARVQADLATKGIDPEDLILEFERLRKTHR